MSPEVYTPMTYAEPQYARGVANGGCGAGGTLLSPETSSCFLSEAHARLNALNMLLQDAAGDLVTVNDRLFGAIPRGVAGKDPAATNKVSGQAGELLGAIEILIERAASVRDEAQRLNSRI